MRPAPACLGPSPKSAVDQEGPGADGGGPRGTKAPAHMQRARGPLADS